MTLVVRLEADIEQRLAALANLTGRTKSYYVRESLLRCLEDMEDLYLALYRQEHPGRRWSMSEVEDEVGLGNRVGRRGGKGVQKTRRTRTKKDS